MWEELKNKAIQIREEFRVKANTAFRIGDLLKKLIDKAESIEDSIPTSLPANGGHADTANFANSANNAGRADSAVHADEAGNAMGVQGRSYQQIIDNARAGLALTSQIPTVNNPTVIINQGGSEKGRFSLNQASPNPISINLDASDIDNLPSGGAVSSVNGRTGEVTGLAEATHTHTKSQITDFAHSHPASDIVGLPESLELANNNEISNTKAVRADDNRLSNARTPLSHTHIASEITGLPTSLPASGGNADTVGNKTPTQIVDDAIAKFPEIPTVNNPAIILQQFGKEVGRFLLNQATEQTITLDTKEVAITTIGSGAEIKSIADICKIGATSLFFGISSDSPSYSSEFLFKIHKISNTKTIIEAIQKDTLDIFLTSKESSAWTIWKKVSGEQIEMSTGTWGGFTMTFSASLYNGFWTRIGNFVTCRTLLIIISDTNFAFSPELGSPKIEGLPFAPKDGQAINPPALTVPAAITQGGSIILPTGSISAGEYVWEFTYEVES